MKLKTIIILILLIVVAKTNAQNFELGKVSIGELEEKSHPKDSSAVAAVLFEKGKNSFEYAESNGFSMVTEVKVRIKIYKKEGYDWATKSLRYYIGSGAKERLTISDAATYNLVAGKIEKTKLKSDGSFDEVINKYWGQKKITLPNVKEGSVIEFSYLYKTESLSSPRDWFFQKTIPVNYSEYKTVIPEYFNYNSNFRGFVSPKVTVEKGVNSITLNSKERVKSGMNVTTNFSSQKVEYNETRTQYIAENLPAVKDEVFVNNVDNYTVSLVQELAMTKYPNQPYKSYSTDWASVVKTIYDYDDFGPELNKTGYFEEDLKGVLASLTKPEEKIDAILKFVKATVKWNDYYGYSCNDGVKKAYKDKSGNIAEINLMLTAMLRYAGLNANPVLVSTRSNGIAMFPNRTAFNYVIAAVENGASYTLLDASDQYATPNVLPSRALNWSGRLIRKDGSSMEIDLTPDSVSNDVITMFYTVDEKGIVTGKLRRQRDAHNALLLRNSLKNLKEEAYVEKLENDNNKIEIQEYKRTNEKELNLPIIESISFTGSNFSEIIGDKIYFKPLLSFASSQNPFKQENREYPVDFGFSFMDKYIVNIAIPEGYTVESIPASINLLLENDFGNFKCLTSVSEKTIQVMVINQINMPIVAAGYYTTLKEFFQKLTDKQNEKIVLRKI
jgi:transglutaminase-like putative cysteine protease